MSSKGSCRPDSQQIKFIEKTNIDQSYEMEYNRLWNLFVYAIWTKTYILQSILEKTMVDF